MSTVLKLYIARERNMGRSLPCEFKWKHIQQEIPSFGVVLNGMDSTANVRCMWAWPVDRLVRSVGMYVAAASEIALLT